MNTKLCPKWVVTLASCVLVALLSWVFLLNHVSPNHVGVAYNSLNGQITVQTNAGWYVTSPFVRVAVLDMLPIRVTIPSDARIINSKIVRLKEDKVLEFVRVQGYSMQLGVNLNNTLMGYAFSGKTFNFLEIMEDGAFKENTFAR